MITQCRWPAKCRYRHRPCHWNEYRNESRPPVPRGFAGTQGAMQPPWKLAVVGLLEAWPWNCRSSRRSSLATVARRLCAGRLHSGGFMGSQGSPAGSLDLAANGHSLPATPSLIEPDNARSNGPYSPVQRHPATRYDRLILKQVYTHREPSGLPSSADMRVILGVCSSMRNEHLIEPVRVVSAVTDGLDDELAKGSGSGHRRDASLPTSRLG